MSDRDTITLPREVVKLTEAVSDRKVKRLTPNSIANLVMADEAWHDSLYVKAEDYDSLLADFEALRTALAAEQPKPSEDVEALRRENERLREALTYDWDQLEACRESLREHMVEIKRLRELLTEARGAKWLVVQDNLLDRIDAALRREETT